MRLALGVVLLVLAAQTMAMAADAEKPDNTAAATVTEKGTIVKFTLVEDATASKAVDAAGASKADDAAGASKANDAAETAKTDDAAAAPEVGAAIHAPEPADAVAESKPTEGQPATVAPSVPLAPAATQASPSDASGASRLLPVTSLAPATDSVGLSDPVPQFSAPVSQCRRGVVCGDNSHSQPFAWRGSRLIPWEAYAQGEYVGPARLAHVPEYRLRVDDRLDFVYIFSVRPSSHSYRLNVRDRVRVESLIAPDVVDREVLIQPDGTVTLRLLGQIPAAGLTIEEFRGELDKRYAQHITNPSITVTPIELNSYLQELRYSVDRRYGAVGGQGSLARVTPEGTIQLPIIGSVPVQGLTLPEVKREIENRYTRVAEGVEVTPILVERAPRYFFVLGEVHNPGRFTMEGPTTATQALAMAGSWTIGGRIRHVVVMRRDANWCLMATKLNLYGALYGKQPCPPDEIWLRDSDIVIVPKTPIETADEIIEQVFTRGLYGVMPSVFNINFAKLSTI